jgi:hypothetical protein
LTKDDTFKRITNNDIYTILQEVRDEVKKTNGRVTRLEDLHLTVLDAHKDLKEETKSSFKIVWSVFLLAASSTLTFLIWLLNKLF